MRQRYNAEWQDAVGKQGDQDNREGSRFARPAYQGGPVTAISAYKVVYDNGSYVAATYVKPDGSAGVQRNILKQWPIPSGSGSGSSGSASVSPPPYTAGQIVLACYMPVAQPVQPGGTTMTRLVIVQGAITTIDMKITSVTQQGDNFQWIYQVEQVYKSGAGYGAWSVVPSGQSGNGYNRYEDMNGSSGLLGNGVQTQNILAGMAVQPAPVGLIVSCEALTVTSGDGTSAIEYWFSYANGIDGICP